MILRWFRVVHGYNLVYIIFIAENEKNGEALAPLGL